ncbi:DUF202 domain-containing protein [Pseudonocardia sp. HH130630-07]|uniref:DUF202 domain-containing protein n=1 Tax=Pseudonocardia sp. HH130630-07 TaxID=1690815 RepID=UPI000814EA32|nr:DUF202 domain-containing protein [Pseudonocardia sp. HH130630-07]ANY05707.1 hypothetical protein AFB00_04620 [Pseudonocardia sp. HH130630-07]
MTSFDPGLQPERTALAWRRTGISLAAASLVAARVTAPAAGVTGVVLCLVAFLICAVVVLGSQRRYRRVAGALQVDGSRLPTGGGTVSLVTVAVVLLGVAAAVAVLAG